MLWQPFISELVTEYVVVSNGFTIKESDVSPVFHKYESPPETSSVAELPMISTISSVIVISGNGNTTTFTSSVSEQLLLITSTL